uniref:Uncharacterized protein n=1 Tax=Panagrolaimus sp. ES5 TaxID=591445 RepID=A0AC34FJ11_9BILA
MQNSEIKSPDHETTQLCSIESDENLHASSFHSSTSFRPTDSIAKFTYKNKTYRALAKNVTPSELAKRFKIRVDGIRVQGNNREYKVIQDKDIFSPLLAPASYEIVYDSKEHIASIIEIKQNESATKHHSSNNSHHHSHQHLHEEARERSHSDATTKKSSSHKFDSTKVKIIFDEKIFEVDNISHVQPSVILEYFKIESNKTIKLKTKKNAIFEVNERKDCFEPEIVPGKYYLLINEKAAEKMEENFVEEVEPENQEFYTVIFETGKTYYISYNPVSPSPNEPLKFPNIKHFYVGLTLNRPLSFMVPYLIAVLRAMAILSHPSNEKISLKSSKHDQSKRHNLICNSSLSTAAFQIAYRINEVAKALHLIINKIANDKIDYNIDSEKEFEDNADPSTAGMIISEFVMDFSGSNLDPVLKLLKKALIDIEELLDLVVESMKEKQATAGKVETALIVEKGKHQRREQKITFENIVDENDEGEYREIAQKDYRILPYTTVAEVGKNRKHFDYIFELIEKIVKASTQNSEPNYKDITHLLNFSAEVLHSIYLHWRFFQEFLHYQDNYFGKDQKRLSVSDVCLTVSQQLKSCTIMWNFIGKKLPFFIDLENGDDGKDISKLWKNYKNDINAAQYSLEICYLTKKYMINN